MLYVLLLAVLLGGCAHRTDYPAIYANLDRYQDGTMDREQVATFNANTRGTFNRTNLTEEEYQIYRTYGLECPMPEHRALLGRAFRRIVQSQQHAEAAAYKDWSDRVDRGRWNVIRSTPRSFSCTSHRWNDMMSSTECN